MKTLEWTTVDKSEWERGPWDNEPDKKQWTDAATGYPCLIVRGPSGALCGYVGVTDGHPAFKKTYNDVGVDIHGGLTFDGFCAKTDDPSQGICHLVEPGENDRVWWLGFDCAHCYDRTPRSEAALRRLGMDRDRGNTYRNQAYVERECTSLARQLKEVAKRGYVA